MRLTVTAGTGSCNHVTIKDAATGEVLAVGTLAELRTGARAGDPLLAQVQQVVRAAGATTKAQARTAIEAAEFV